MTIHPKITEYGKLYSLVAEWNRCRCGRKPKYYIIFNGYRLEYVCEEYLTSLLPPQRRQTASPEPP